MIIARNVTPSTLRKMINLLIFLLICFGMVVTMLENVVAGYQDRNGFHYYHRKESLDMDHET